MQNAEFLVCQEVDLQTLRHCLSGSRIMVDQSFYHLTFHNMFFKNFLYIFRFYPDVEDVTGIYDYGGTHFTRTQASCPDDGKLALHALLLNEFFK